MEKQTLEELIMLADYFRGALKDEVSLPENSTSMSKLIKVDGISMIQLSGKATHYRSVLDKIESALEKQIDQRVGVKTPAKKEAKVNKKPVVTAETNINKTDEGDNKVTENIKDLMPKKETDKSKEIYGSLLALPKIEPTTEESLIEAWHHAKGNEAKAKLYTKVKDLLNNQDLPIAVIRADLAKFVQRVEKKIKANNDVEFVGTLQKEGIDFNLTVKPEDLISPEILTNGKTQYEKDGEFNLLLLTGKDNIDDVDPQDYVKLRAMWLRVTGRERQAIDEITKFYSDSKKGVIWSAEQARLFLNNLFKVNEFKLLKRLMSNVLLYKQEKENDYKLGIKHCKSIMRAFTRYRVEQKEKDKNGKTVTSFKNRTWPDHKINNFIDSVIKKLVDSGQLAKAEETKKAEEGKKVYLYNVVYKQNDKGKIDGHITGENVNTNIVNYDNTIAFKKACEVIAKANAKEGEYKINYTVQKAQGTGEGTSKTKTFHTDKKLAENKVQAQQKRINPVKKQENSPQKPNKPSVGNNSAEKYQKTKEEKEALKKAKKAVKPSDFPQRTPIKKRPEYSVLITKEKDGTFTCVLNGFGEAVKTTGSKTIEAAKKDFYNALLKYSEKIKLENERARTHHKRGKKLHLKPDFSTGELTFLLKDTGS